MVKYDKEEKRLIIPADINYYSLEEYKRGYQEGYEDGYASGITACRHYKDEYLTFVITSGGYINFEATSSNATKSIEYRIGDGDWQTITSSTYPGSKINVSEGDVVQFRGNNAAYYDRVSGYSNFQGTTAGFIAEGNIMSLLDAENFREMTTIETRYAFGRLFHQVWDALKDISNLVLPATTLSSSCYWEMFFSCTSITKAPELPATTLATNCYSQMFAGCTSLATAPKLPATKLAAGCYQSMFMWCNSLTTVPELPATELYEFCYISMFNSCTSLTTAPALPATTLAGRCYDSMFAGCTNLTGAPELPAIILPNNCYSEMFKDCTNLNYIKCLATDISSYMPTYEWLSGVSSTGTFVTPSTTNWATGVNGIPEGWTRVDA